MEIEIFSFDIYAFHITLFSQLNFQIDLSKLHHL